MKDQEMAFPQGRSAGSCSITEGGMTLRDYFAAKAMAMLIEKDNNVGSVNRDVAQNAYWYADAMLQEREK